MSSFQIPRARTAAILFLTAGLLATGAPTAATAAPAAPAPFAAATSAASSNHYTASLTARYSKPMITTAALNLRSSPSTSGRIIKVLKKGTRVTVVGSKGVWRKVKVGSRSGWVHGSYLKAVTAKASTSLKVTKRSSAKTELGKTLVFAGKTSKKLKGKRVQLQIKSGTKWRTVASRTVSSKLTFTVRAKATRSGSQYYRVYAPSTRTTKAAKSPSYKMVVWRWFYLDGRQVDSANLYDWDQFKTIGGKNYTHSPSFGWALGGYNRDGWADYNVNYRCTKFRATIGLSDRSTTGAARTFSLRVDDLTIPFGTRSIGAGLPVSANISGAYRIRLNANLNGNDTWGMAVFGNPKVYCSARP